MRFKKTILYFVLKHTQVVEHTPRHWPFDVYIAPQVHGQRQQCNGNKVEVFNLGQSLATGWLDAKPQLLLYAFKVNDALVLTGGGLEAGD